VTHDFGDFLAEGRTVVGGGAALCPTLGFSAGSLVHDFQPKTDPDTWARKGAAFGGVLGLAALGVSRHRIHAMSQRTRWYVVLVTGVLAMFIYSRFTGAWSEAAYHEGAAGVMVLVGALGFPWMEFAPDGAFRRRPQS
jgi:hypothetical protein